VVQTVGQLPVTTKAQCDPRPFPVVFLVDIVAVGQVFPSQYFSFPLSVSFHRCYMLDLIYAFVMSEGQTGES